MMAARNVTETSEILSQRLRLRRLTAADAPLLQAIVEQPEDDALAAIEQQGDLTYGIFTREADELVGMAGLEARDEPYVFSLWFWLDAEQRGHGHATEAAGTLARHALRTLGALRVEVYCRPDDERGRLVPQRLGFQRTGRARLEAGGPMLERWALGDSPAVMARARASWAPLARDLADRLDGAAISQTAMKIDWRTDLGAVEVDCAVAIACERPWLVVTAPVGPADRMTATEALAHNGTLAAGALVLVEDRYQLRFAAPLDGTPAWKLRQCIELIGNEAIRLALPTSRPTSDGAFGNYAD